ncbi:M14 family metallopeptidase [Pseudomonas sp. SDM007_2]|uniref:M14 family metallopeptidase n=1 Tax=Pseudomonas hygromyciniae TaxID=2812000 RepID=UPI00196801A2|nr:M14 family metallopeptidase [Pseudomonas hygromyciniae]MBN0978556.1 M14 family metallopeptidase [Pseudomonas hygromyciniae]
MDLSCFSQSYAEARQKFLQACASAGLEVQSHPHPLPGSDGEELALDVALAGSPTATNLLVLSSGLHGVEGFCGSAVQVDHLRNREWLQHCQRQDLAVLYLHAINPYGFSWLRRVNEDNVDLNRNFIDFAQPLPDNPDYRILAPLLLPRRQPPTLFSTLGLAGYALRHGRKTLQSAITRGQHSHPEGLFFAGTAPAWSNLQLRQIIRRLGNHCRRIGWIDVHTGLGPCGVGERIYKGRNHPSDIARARSWWGPQVTTNVDGTSSSAMLNGTLDLAVMEECPHAQYNGLTLEYGTQPGPRVLEALRADHWLHTHPQTAQARRVQIKRQLRDAFYIDTEGWKRQVLEQAREVTALSLRGLATRLE